MAKSGWQFKLNRLPEFLKSIEVLTTTGVMVGVPDDKAGRREGDISNAALAYIHDNGAPEAHVPARPFMRPGILAVQSELIAALLAAAKAAAAGELGRVTKLLHTVGLIASRSIKKRISEGIPPPLAESTIAGRIRRVKGKKRRDRIEKMLGAGTPASRQSGAEGAFTPLVVTGQLRNAITYVLRRLPASATLRRGVKR